MKQLDWEPLLGARLPHYDIVPLASIRRAVTTRSDP